MQATSRLRPSESMHGQALKTGTRITVVPTNHEELSAGKQTLGSQSTGENNGHLSEQEVASLLTSGKMQKGFK